MSVQLTCEFREGCLGYLCVTVTNMPDRDNKGRGSIFFFLTVSGGFPSITVTKAEAVYATVGQEAE